MNEAIQGMDRAGRQLVMARMTQANGSLSAKRQANMDATDATDAVSCLGMPWDHGLYVVPPCSTMFHPTQS